MKFFSDLWKFFVKLTPDKQLIGILFAAILFLGFYFFNKDNLNQKAHIELKLAYKKRLDTCEVVSTKLQQELSYWKDSLASEKLKNALIEINNMKKLMEAVKLTEKNIINNNNKVKNKQYQILNKLKNEK